jgi:hypothetical protein
MNKTLEQLYKRKRILEQRLYNFERRNDNLEGNFVGQIRNLKRRINEIEEEIVDYLRKTLK